MRSDHSGSSSRTSEGWHQQELFTTAEKSSSTTPMFAPPRFLRGSVTAPRDTSKGYTGDFSGRTESPFCCMSSASWKRWVTAARRAFSGPQQLGLRTGARECSSSLWPTARAITGGAELGQRKKDLGRLDSGGGDLQAAASTWTTPQAHDQHGGDPRRCLRLMAKGSPANLSDDVLLWQTPATDSFRSRGGSRRGEMGLDQQARSMYPTPASRDYRAPNTRPYRERSGSTKGEQLPNFIRHCFRPVQDNQPSGPTCWCGTRTCAQQSHARRLNPLFVTWMMGWPIWWCTTAPRLSAPAEMESWLSKARRRMQCLLSD